MESLEVERILLYFDEFGVDAEKIERVLELGAGTIEAWKTNAPSEGLALLRLIRCMPWLLEAAEHGFDSAVARYLLVEQAAKTFL